jgi:hypothetical protein
MGERSQYDEENDDHDARAVVSRSYLDITNLRNEGLLFLASEKAILLLFSADYFMCSNETIRSAAVAAGPTST